MTKVSIIIPSFNRAKVLQRAIASVQNQTFFDWELWVVDDFSTDSTRAFVLEKSVSDVRVKYLCNKAKGANQARNEGLSRAQGKYVVFLDSDDELCPDMLERHFDTLETFSDAKLSVSFVQAYRESNSTEWISDTVNSDRLLLDFLIKKVTWPINSAMVRRDFLLSNGICFHPKLLNGQDYSFFLEILRFNPEICFISEILSINHHLSGESKQVKVSAGDSLKYKLSRMRSRNIAFRVAWKGLPFMEFLDFLPYYSKYQLGLLGRILKTGFK